MQSYLSYMAGWLVSLLQQEKLDGQAASIVAEVSYAALAADHAHLVHHVAPVSYATLWGMARLGLFGTALHCTVQCLWTTYQCTVLCCAYGLLRTVLCSIVL